MTDQPIELPLPSNIEYCHVQMFIMKAVGDGEDEGHEPDGVAYAGARVKLKAQPSYVRNATAIPRPAIIALTEINCEVDSGGVLRYRDRDTGALSTLDGVLIIAGNSAATNPTMWPYDVTIDHPSTDLFIEFSFMAEAGKTIDLATVIPVPASPGVEVERWLEAINTVHTARDQIVETMQGIGQLYYSVIEQNEQAQAAADRAVVNVNPATSWTGAVALSSEAAKNKVHHATLTGNVALTLPAGEGGVSYGCTLVLTQDASATPRTLSVAGTGVRKQWNQEPILSTRAGAVDVVSLFWDGMFWNVAVAMMSLGANP